MPIPVFNAGERSRYVRAEFKARTLDELRARCGEDGAAAVEEARHYALVTWLMHSDAHTGAEQTAALHYRGHVRAALGTPKLSPHPWRSPLRLLSVADRQAVEATGKRLLSDWEAAGSPGLIRAIENAQQLVHSARIARNERQAAMEGVDFILNNGGPYGSNDKTTSEGQCGPQPDLCPRV
jgi:hypothetical protein